MTDQDKSQSEKFTPYPGWEKDAYAVAYYMNVWHPGDSGVGPQARRLLAALERSDNENLPLPPAAPVDGSIYDGEHGTRVIWKNGRWHDLPEPNRNA